MTITTLLTIMFSLAFATYSCYWRKWFGGDYPQWIKDHIKPAIRRFIMNVVNIAMMFGVCSLFRNIEWYYSLYIALVMQLIYWNYTFGMYMDIGRDKDYVTPEDKEDYNKPWFAPILNWIFKEEERYGRLYDFCGMLIRFIFPGLMFFFIGNFNLGICMLGPIIALAYELDHIFDEKGLKTKYRFLIGFDEGCSGFMTGLLFTLIGML